MTDSPDSIAWWQGWYSPRPLEQWWRTKPKEWQFIGHSWRSKCFVYSYFLTHPPPGSREYKEHNGRPQGVMESNDGIQKMNGQVILKHPSGEKGSAPCFTPDHHAGKGRGEHRELPNTTAAASCNGPRPRSRSPRMPRTPWRKERLPSPIEPAATYILMADARA